MYVHSHNKRLLIPHRSAGTWECIKTLVAETLKRAVQTRTSTHLQSAVSLDRLRLKTRQRLRQLTAPVRGHRDPPAEHSSVEVSQGAHPDAEEQFCETTCKQGTLTSFRTKGPSRRSEQRDPHVVQNKGTLTSFRTKGPSRRSADKQCYRSLGGCVAGSQAWHTAMDVRNTT